MVRHETYAVEIGVPAEQVFAYLSDVATWPTFSPFALAVEHLGEGQWVVTSPQGEVRLWTAFDEDRLLLDHYCGADASDRVLIPYRVVRLSDERSLLIMTNVAFEADSDAAFAEQLAWMVAELNGAKDQLERRIPE